MIVDSLKITAGLAGGALDTGDAAGGVDGGAWRTERDHGRDLTKKPPYQLSEAGNTECNLGQPQRMTL